MKIVGILLILALTAGIAWLLARREKLPGWKTALLVLFCFGGGAIGNLALGFLDGLTLKYVYFSVLGVAAGCWFGYLLFRKLFE